MTVNFAGKLVEQSADANYCLRFALTTANYEAFAEPCTHSHFEDPEPSMGDLANRSEETGGRGRNATADCWDGECNRCGKTGGKEAILCNNCAVVGCKECIQRTRDDLAVGIEKRHPKAPAVAVPPLPAFAGRGGSNTSKKGGKKALAKPGRGVGKAAAAKAAPKAKRPKPLPPQPMCPTGWRCDACQGEDSARDHHCKDVQFAEVHNFFAELKNAISVWGIKAGHVNDVPVVDDDSGDEDYVEGVDDESSEEDTEDDEEEDRSSCSEEAEEVVASESEEDESSSSDEAPKRKGRRSKNAARGQRRTRKRRNRAELSVEERLQQQAQAGAQARLRHLIRNKDQLRAHKVRTVKLRELRKEQLMNLDAETAMEWKDYMGKLEARKSMQGTSENLGRKISLHGSLFIMRSPTADIRAAHPEVDWTKFPAADDDCFVQVNMYGASDESKQSAFHMGGVMSVQYPALKKAFPWLTSTIPYSDQCGDYRSTAATVFNHEMGRLSGLRVKLVLHSEVGEGKGEVDMRLGQKSQQFVSILARLPRTCAADLFTHLELCAGGGDYNLELAISLQLFKEGSSGAIAFLEQCAAVEYPAEGGLVLREIHGYGPGVVVSQAEVKAKDHYGIMDAAETGSYALQQSGGDMAPQRRDSDSSKKQATGERNQKKKIKKKNKEKKFRRRPICWPPWSPSRRRGSARLAAAAGTLARRHSIATLKMGRASGGRQKSKCHKARRPSRRQLSYRSGVLRDSLPMKRRLLEAANLNTHSRLRKKAVR